MSDVNGTVTAIQGKAVSDAAPEDKNVLTWVESEEEWQPKPSAGALEPWVGAVNSQEKVIKRIPWTCRTTGTTASSTGVVVTVPTDRAVSFTIYGVFRAPSSGAGVRTKIAVLSISNDGGTLVAIPDEQVISSTLAGSITGLNNPTFRLTSSGTTVTLEAVFFSAGGGVVAECQGYVDLMLI